MRTWIAILLCYGCAGTLPEAREPTAAEWERIRAADAAWDARELGDYGDKCRPDDIVIAPVDDATLEAECGEGADECMTLASPGFPWWGASIPQYIVEQAYGLGHIVHAHFHYRSYCTGRRPDYGHCTPDVWTEDLPALGGARQEPNPGPLRPCAQDHD